MRLSSAPLNGIGTQGMKMTTSVIVCNLQGPWVGAPSIIQGTRNLSRKQGLASAGCYGKLGWKVSDYLSDGNTCVYFLLPEMKMMTASAMAAAGIAKPTAQEMFSWTYTMTEQAMRDPMFTAK